MLKHIDRIQELTAWRTQVLTNMRQFISCYRTFGNPLFVEYARELGEISLSLKQQIELLEKR